MRRTLSLLLAVAVLGMGVWAPPAAAQQGGDAFRLPSIQVDMGGEQGAGDLSVAMQILFVITVLSLAPSIMLMVTSFTRIMIVLSFVSRALSLQQMPPRQVLISLAIFLTLFVMAPTAMEINQRAVQPYMAGELEQLEALKAAADPLRVFMFKNTSRDDLAFFLRTAEVPKPQTRADVPIWTLIPAFMLSEIKKAFVMGVLIFIPFVVIDMVVASVLMSMGMMMLPPVMISLPFKILLFVLVDGWSIISQSLVQTYGMG